MKPRGKSRHIWRRSMRWPAPRHPLSDARHVAGLDTGADPVMPKSRYRIMSGYMPKVGGKGLDMMSAPRRCR